MPSQSLSTLYPSVQIQAAHGLRSSLGVCRIGQRNMLMDVMHKPGRLYEADSEKAMNYKRLELFGGAGMNSIMHDSPGTCREAFM